LAVAGGRFGVKTLLVEGRRSMEHNTTGGANQRGFLRMRVANAMAEPGRIHLSLQENLPDPFLTEMTYTFSLLPGTYGLARLTADSPVPAWAIASSGFSSITRTTDELSIVCRDAIIPEDTRAERGWRVVKLHGPFAFDEVGILSSFISPLAKDGVVIVAISTFDTDYILVKAPQLEQAIEALRAAGHSYQDPDRTGDD
jgi:hypothetical protein